MNIGTKLSVAFSISAAYLLAVGIAAVIVVQHLDGLLSDAAFYSFQGDQVAVALRALHASPAKLSEHRARLQDLEKWARTGNETKLIDEARQQLSVSVPAATDRLEQLGTYYRQAAMDTQKQLIVIHRHVVTGLVLILIGSIVLLVALMFLIRHWLFYPVLQLDERLARVAAGDLGSQPPVAVAGELAGIAASIEKTAARLKELEERMGKTERLAAVGEACSHVSHSLGSLVHSIQTLAQHGSDAESDDADARAMFGFIMATANKLDTWVRDLMSSIRPVEPRPVSLQLEPLIRDSVSLLEPTFSKRGIEVQFRLADDLPAVAVDRHLFQQAFLAVLTNAMEASPDGGRIDIGLAPADGGRVSLWIEDTGEGLDEATQQRAFEPFFTTKTQAAGLGLTIARDIILRHKGSITIESESRKGTRVLIQVPVA